MVETEFSLVRFHGDAERSPRSIRPDAARGLTISLTPSFRQ
jgi:hypothetical protein